MSQEQGCDSRSPHELAVLWAQVANLQGQLEVLQTITCRRSPALPVVHTGFGPEAGKAPQQTMSEMSRQSTGASDSVDEDDEEDDSLDWPCSWSSSGDEHEEDVWWDMDSFGGRPGSVGAAPCDVETRGGRQPRCSLHNLQAVSGMPVTLRSTFQEINMQGQVDLAPHRRPHSEPASTPWQSGS